MSHTNCISTLLDLKDKNITFSLIQKKRHSPQNPIQCNRLKQHERIGFMSHTNCISTLLDLKDKNITFSEN